MFSDSETGGLYYTVLGLLPFAIYLEYFKPTVNNAERQYLKSFVKNELILIAASPIFLLLAVGAIKLLSFGSEPPYGILYFYFPLTFWYCPGHMLLPRSEDGTSDIKYSVISRTIVTAYFVCHFSLMLLLFGLFGPVPFEAVINRWYGEPAVSTVVIVEKNGALVGVYMSQGYFTQFLHEYAPFWAQFLILFYVSHIKLTATFRWLVFFLNLLFDNVVNAVSFVFE